MQVELGMDSVQTATTAGDMQEDSHVMQDHSQTSVGLPALTGLVLLPPITDRSLLAGFVSPACSPMPPAPEATTYHIAIAC